MPERRVFISYSHRDSAHVARIFRALSELDVAAWTDQQIRAGDSWMSEIESALNEAKVIVLCVSPSFLASDWAQLEIGVALSRARESDIRVIPLILTDTVLPDALKRFQYLDARKLSPEQVADEIKKVVEALR
jgi:TIR domain